MDMLTKLFRIRKTCLEMLKERGYLVSEVGEGPMQMPARGGCGRPRGECDDAERLSAPNTSQEEINLEKDKFRERFGENPRKEDLTILVPRQDDPTEQVIPPTSSCEIGVHAVLHE
jgi:DNA-directed RNA polymerase I, II, and III subunit RPABC1